METASGMSLKMMLIPFLYSIVFTSFRIWNAYCFYIVVNRYGFFFLLAISDILVSRVADDDQYFIYMMWYHTVDPFHISGFLRSRIVIVG